MSIAGSSWGDALTRAHQQAEIRQAFDRYAAKLLHPPLASLRSESRAGSPHGLLDALKRLFDLKD